MSNAPFFSADGTRLSCLTWTGDWGELKKFTLQIAGKDGVRQEIMDRGYSQVYPIYWSSPQLDHWVYSALRKDAGEKEHGVLIMDGKPLPRLGDAFMINAAFTPDGKHFAYDAQTEKGWTRIVDNIKGAEVPQQDHMLTFADKPLLYYFIHDKKLFRGKWE